MNALAKTVLTGLAGAVTREGAARVSKTKVAAHVTAVSALSAILPGVLAKDPAAIGQLVLMTLGWLGTLWGRGNGG